MIEHTFDLIEHINSVGDILRPSGHYFIIVPDKNYTFDYFKPVSTIEEVVDRHIMGPHKLALKTVLLEKGRRTHNDAKRHWSGDHGEPTYDKEDILRAIRNFEQIRNNPISASGFHNWVFTHKSFAEVMKKLVDLGMITMRMEACFPTPVDTFSFNAILTNQ